jgi:hypothetical protein
VQIPRWRWGQILAAPEHDLQRTTQSCFPSFGCLTAQIHPFPPLFQAHPSHPIATMSNLPVYLVDYSMFNPPAELRVDFYKSQDDAWKWKVRSSKWATHCSAAVRSQLPTALGDSRATNPSIPRRRAAWQQCVWGPAAKDPSTLHLPAAQHCQALQPPHPQPANPTSIKLE